MSRAVVRLLAGLLAASGLLVGCAGAGPVADEGFTLAVVPEQVQGFSIAGQEVVFLASLAEGGGDTPVVVTATARGAGFRVEGPELRAGGEVAEVVVVPDAAAVGGTVTVTVEGRHGAATDAVERSFDVVEGEDDRASYAAGLGDRFVGWLGRNRPELGIDDRTAWTGTMVSPQWLVVSHYLFFSDEWELHVAWHIMVAPHDWARADLRRRFAEQRPSAAFEIPSVSADAEPRETAVPEAVWR